MDYGTLAQLANPGNSPLAVNPAAAAVDPQGIARWQNLNALSQQALQGGGQEAALNLQKQILDSQVREAGQPGLLDTAKLSNLNAASAVARQPQVAKVTDEEIRKHLGDIQAAIESGKFDAIKPMANAYYEAKTKGSEADIQSVIRAAKGQNVDGYIMGTEPEHDKAILNAVGMGMASPASRWHLPVAEVNANSRKEAAKTNADARRQEMEFKASAAQALEKLKAELKANKPFEALSPEQQAILQQYGTRGEDGKLSISDERGAHAVLEYELRKKAAAQISVGGASAATAGNLGVPGVVAPTNPSVPPATNKNAGPVNKPVKSEVVTILSNEDYRKLASGTRFKGPDGLERIKP